MTAKSVNLRQLRAFVEISDKGSFVAATSSLHLSQPALSQCIRQLEDHIGSPLFNRTTRSVSLTPLGMSFLPHARDLLNRFDALMTDVQEVVAKKRGQVTIACLPSVASRLMPRVVAVNERKYPGIRVIIRDTNMKGVRALLLSGEADLGIGSAVADQMELDSAIFAQDEMHAVLPVTSPLARKRTLRWSEIADCPLVTMTYDTGVRELLDQAAAKQNIDFNIVSEVSNLATLTGMIEEGIGISVLPSLALPRNAHSFIRHRPLTEPRIRRTIRMFWKSNVGLSPAAMAILASMHDAIAADRAMTLDQKVDWKLDELKRVLAR